MRIGWGERDSRSQGSDLSTTCKKRAQVYPAHSRPIRVRGITTRWVRKVDRLCWLHPRADPFSVAAALLGLMCMEGEMHG